MKSRLKRATAERGGFGGKNSGFWVRSPPKMYTELKLLTFLLDLVLLFYIQPRNFKKNPA
jgi:hypothetical protein